MKLLQRGLDLRVQSSQIRICMVSTLGIAIMVLARHLLFGHLDPQINIDFMSDRQEAHLS